MSEIRNAIKVNFGAGSEAAAQHVSVELDSRPDGLNQGRSSFLPGETAYFLIFRTPNIRIDHIIPSAGSVRGANAGEVRKTEDISFDDAATSSLSVPASSIQSVTWLGNSLGGLTLQGDRTTVKAISSGVAVARVTYVASPDAYGIVSPTHVNGEVDFSITVVIKATAT